MAAGREAFGQGDMAAAVDHFRAAGEASARAGDRRGHIDALTHCATAYQFLGRYPVALSLLNRARTLAVEGNEPAGRLARIQNAQAGVLIMMHRLGDAALAAELLSDALRVAESEHDDSLRAVVLINRGNLLAAQEKHAEALSAYEAAVEAADRAGFPPTALRARVNAAASAARGKEFAKADALAEAAAAPLRELPDSFEKAFLLLTAGQTDQRLAGIGPDAVAPPPAELERLIGRAHRAYMDAGEVAGRIGNNRLQSYARGYLGELYEGMGKYDEALVVTRQAAALGQRDSDISYRWRWQEGRLLAKQKEFDRALQAYEVAKNLLEGRRSSEDNRALDSVRGDLALGYGNRPFNSTFRTEAGKLYFELADLQLRKAAATTNKAQSEALLKSAQSTVELLKAAELEDYFKDECVNQLRSRRKEVTKVGDKTAVIYLIPLDDRTELLVTTANGVARERADIDARTLDQVVEQFRFDLRERAEHEYLKGAKQLYEKLIRPLEKHLAGVDTLVFVPDGKLRKVPMAALHDGEHFLVERYAVAVTPGLDLMEPERPRRKDSRLFLGGVSAERPGFTALPYVESELRGIGGVYPGTRPLLNREFNSSALKSSVEGESYDIIHIASHGHFGAYARDTYVLAWDKKLTLDELETTIQPVQFRGRAVELLTLSACETAVGNDNAALGLAGVAIKAGARSALASLWCVRDESASVLVTEFYRQLAAHPEFSKARALQAAQVMMIHDPDFDHPDCWAPFLLIGNWL